jgi:hypothetical protein
MSSSALSTTTVAAATVNDARDVAQPVPDIAALVTAPATAIPASRHHVMRRTFLVSSMV